MSESDEEDNEGSKRKSFPRSILGVRRVQRVGYSTLTVSLPHEWADRNHLESGDYVTITQEEDGALRIEKKDLRKNLNSSPSNCPKCGARVPSDSHFCKECGINLDRDHILGE